MSVVSKNAVKIVESNWMNWVTSLSTIDTFSGFRSDFRISSFDEYSSASNRDTMFACVPIWEVVKIYLIDLLIM